MLMSCGGAQLVKPTHKISGSYQGLDSSKRIFLLPVTTEVSEAKQGSDKVQALLAAQLKASGWDVATMSDANYQTLWQQITDSVGGLYSPVNGQFEAEKYSQAIYKLNVIINQQEQYAAVLQPEIVLRSAQLDGSDAKWDGVTVKQVEKRVRPNKYDWTGDAPAISVRINAYDASPKWLFTSYGGLSLTQDVLYTANDKATFKIKDDLFENDKNIDKGIALALQPIKAQ